MDNSPIQDFNNLSFENWLDFVFDAKWSADSDETDDATIWNLDADPEVFVKNCIELFENPAFLPDRFTPEQLEGGFFSFILSPHWMLDWWIWKKDNPVNLRRRFIFSSVNVFKQVFTKISLKHSCFMWWDCLRSFDKNKDLRVADWMFEALSQILKIDSIDCQMSALHGLGHIEHSGKKDLIEKFLRENPDFAEEEYALAAIEGNVL